MCGIAGIASAHGKVDGAAVARMAAAVRHRGPDDEGLWVAEDGSAALGHRRLSIIDLSAGGHQPMSAGHNHVVFNGEIYNYRELRQELIQRGRAFHSASDTEVLLAAYDEWGPDCLSKLNGMFAFALFDARTRQLLIARDRAGEKPVFYRHANGQLAFASELKGLLTDKGLPRSLDAESLDFYLAYGYVPGDRCIIRGVRKLPQGHALVYDTRHDTIRTWPYWSLPPAPAGDVAPDEELLERLDTLLLNSVRLRLIADVPVGIMLSGGVDSSLVTAMAARVSTKVRTFTIAFPGHPRFDESPHAQLVSAHFGTDHTTLAAEPATVDILPELARQYDEPLADSSMVPTYLVSRLIRRHATVALGGDGGDELFGGYPHHSWIQSQARWRRMLPGAVRSWLRLAAPAVLPLGIKGRNYALGVVGTPAEGLAQFNLYFDERARRQLLGLDVNGASPERFKSALAPAAATALQQATIADFRSYLVDDILVKVDRASMLAGLEVRAPWLDPGLIAFAFGAVPDRLRATAAERKVLPRALAARLLPPAFDLTRKQGFSLPLDAWFKGEWGATLTSVLADAPPALFDRRAVQRLLAHQRRGLPNTQRLFALAIFELWRREYQVSF